MEFALGIAFSIHLGFSGASFNETHPYVSVSENNWTISTTINSHEKISVSLTHSFDLTPGLSLTAGLATGYNASPINTIPFLGLTHGQYSLIPTPAGVVLIER